MSACVGVHSIYCYYLLSFLNFKLFCNDLSVLSASLTSDHLKMFVIDVVFLLM